MKNLEKKLENIFTIRKYNPRPHQVRNILDYLNPEKLFGIIDLDIQSQSLSACSNFQNTEELYKELYAGGNLDLGKVPNHRIWVTGLIHKEAYFLLPSLQDVFDNSPVKALYKAG